MQLNKRTCPVALLICFSMALAARAEIKVGEKFPEIATSTIGGKLRELTKGRVVLVDFWASWCVPCARSFPVMDELQKTYGAKGLVIIAVNVDEIKADMESFLKAHPVTFSVVRDAKQRLVEKTGIAAMPSSFLLDKNGKVAFAHSGFHGSCLLYTSP